MFVVVCRNHWDSVTWWDIAGSLDFTRPLRRLFASSSSSSLSLRFFFSRVVESRLRPILEWPSLVYDLFVGWPCPIYDLFSGGRVPSTTSSLGGRVPFTTSFTPSRSPSSAVTSSVRLLLLYRGRRWAPWCWISSTHRLLLFGGEGIGLLDAPPLWGEGPFIGGGRPPTFFQTALQKGG